MQPLTVLAVFATSALAQDNDIVQQRQQAGLAMPDQFQPGQEPDPTATKPQPPPTSIPMKATLEGEDGFEYAVYQTEPNLRAPTLNFKILAENLDRIQPGYLFFDPMTNTESPGLGPLMYDTYTGELVWDGKAWVGFGSFATQNTHVCDFMGEVGKHICYTDSYTGKSAAHRVFNQHYESVEPPHGFNGTGRFGTVNGHEFDMNPGGWSFQQLIYWAREWDLSAEGGLVSGGLLDPCMQEVDVVTGEEIFSWCGTEHGLDFRNSTHRAPKQASVSKNPWDFAHANAIDKNVEGDYIMSIRYYNQVWKIAGPNASQVHGISPGTVMWKFGVKGDFDILPEGEHTFHQHDCRFISTGATEEYISVFDNHNTQPTENILSAGKVYKLNNETMTATLVQRRGNPEPEPCLAMGSNRRLPNGNQLIGWGQRPFFSEFDPNGEIVLHATFKEEHNSTYNYRVLKSPWTGLPLTRPKAVAYSLDCDASQLVVYASWNGATEVRSWRISIASSATHPWVLLGIYPRTGFETRIAISQSTIAIFAGATPRHVQVEALDATGAILSATETLTFVPRPELIQPFECDREGCHGPRHFLYEASQNFVLDCAPAKSMGWGTALSLFLGVEGVLYLWRNAGALASSGNGMPVGLKEGTGEGALRLRW